MNADPIRISGHVSELIANLHKILAQYGDLHVCIVTRPDDDGDEVLEVTGISIPEYQDGSRGVLLFDWEFNLRQGAEDERI